MWPRFIEGGILMTYDPGRSEPAWQQAWEEAGAFHAKRRQGHPKFYCLEMYPYPSGSMHMGHVRNYSIGDAVARAKRALGYDVLYPMGFDSFGMPAENAAKSVGGHPREITEANIDRISAQLKRMGFSYDWTREVRSHDPRYYRWNQWFFLKMYEMGMIERRTAAVNWDPVEESVLANEQVIDGRGWRSGALVEQRQIPQWFVKVTAYAEQLWEDLDSIEYPEHVKALQRDWIGRSEGARIQFPLHDGEGSIEVFTTRPDTIFGVTFVTLAPDHPMAGDLMSGSNHEEDWKAMRDEVANLSEFDRSMLKTKRGIPTGRTVLHPLTEEPIPVWIGEFVLSGYGTGAVMAVPAHDERDHEFANQHGIPIRRALSMKEGDDGTSPIESAETGAGWMVNSPIEGFDGRYGEDAKRAVIVALESSNTGHGTVEWKIRDWLVSRQRYWGTPIPMVHCTECGIVPVPEDQLPVELPDDVDFAKGGNPLETSPTFVEVPCPACGLSARRETDTMDTFIDSSWYFLRYTDALNEAMCFSEEAVSEWMNVDFYCGGIEHAQLHLIYARCWTKILRDLGLHDHDEPFHTLLCQGMVNHPTYSTEDGEPIFPHEVNLAENPPVHKPTGKPVVVGRTEKMSKSKRNVVDPESMLNRYGADTMRLFILFAAGPTAGMEWSDAGVEANHRVIQSLSRIPEQVLAWTGGASEMDDWMMARLKERRLDWEAAIDAHELRRAVEISHYDVPKDLGWYQRRGGANPQVGRILLETWAFMLAAATPHLAEDWWAALGQEDLLATRTMEEPVEQPTPMDHVLQREEYVRSALENAHRVLRIAQRHLEGAPQRMHVRTAPSWKRDLARFALGHIESGGDVKQLASLIPKQPFAMGEMVGPVMAAWNKMLPKVFKWSPEERILILSELDETDLLMSISEFLGQQIGVEEVEVRIAGEGEDIGGRASFAMPLAPSIVFA